MHPNFVNGDRQADNAMSRIQPTRVVDREDESDSSEHMPRPRRTHAERREEAEKRMLDAAVRIVAERGIDYLTLAECGEAAGYSRGLAAHYFGSKDALVAAIANHIVSNYVQRSRGGSRGKKGLEGFLNAVDFYIESGRNRVLELRAFNAVLGAAPTHRDLADAIAAVTRDSVQSLADGLEICRKQGSVRADIDPRSQATMILAMMRGVMAQWLLDPEGVDLDKIKAELLSSLRRSLAP
jgi:AcrR family transcriptional regulator